MMMTVPIVGIPKRYTRTEAALLHVEDQYRFSILLSRLEFSKFEKLALALEFRSIH